MRTTLADGESVATPNEDAATGNTSGYRLDLDGLRGIAIALVAVFHIWFGRVSGGVDVFLTLSGYFFVASLLKHVIATQPASVSWGQAINPWPRLWRLLRRLIPAMFLVLAVITVLIAWTMPKTRWGPLGAEVQASALYYQNWHLAFQSQDYSAADSAISPMQHLWSMSMQGQFFVVTLVAALLFAGVLRALSRRYDALAKPTVIRGIVGFTVLGVALVSFAWAHYRHGINQPFNYYDTVARLWEPLAGGLLAVWMPRLALPQRIRTLLGIVALALIGTCGWWIAGVAEYPAAWALVPVGATLLLIWVDAPQTAMPATGPTPTSRVLAHPRLVWLGSIAYALYLWHWPLLIFYLNWRYQDDVSWLEGTAILAVSVVLAWATTRFVEAPLRSGRGSSKLHQRVLIVGLIAATVASAVTITVWQRDAANATVNTANLDPRLYPGARAYLYDAPVPNLPPQPSPDLAPKDWPITWEDSVTGQFTDAPDRIRSGTYGDLTATRTIALVGGSHADQWIDALNVIGQRHHFKIKTYLRVGCALTTTHVYTWFGRKYPECNEWSRRVMAQLAVDKPDVVFTNSTRPSDDGTGDYVPSDYQEIFAQFRDRGQRVIALRDNPWVSAKLKPPECLATGRKPSVCGVDRDRAMAQVDPTLAIAGQYPNMTFLDYTDGICNDTYCPAVVGNIVVYRDFHHLTATYIRSFIPALEGDLQRSLRWW